MRAPPVSPGVAGRAGRGASGWPPPAMSAVLRLKAGLFQPGPVAFATLFAIECLARATLTVVLPVEALRVVGDARDVSLLFAARS